MRVDNANAWTAFPFTMSDKNEGLMSNAVKTVVLGDEAVHVGIADVAERQVEG